MLLPSYAGRWQPEKVASLKSFSAFGKRGRRDALRSGKIFSLLGLGILINVWLNAITYRFLHGLNVFEENFRPQAIPLLGEKHQATLLVGKGNALGQDLFVLSGGEKIGSQWIEFADGSDLPLDQG